MPERTGETRIEAPLEACLEVINDIPAFPSWVTGYKTATVEEADGHGRPVIATYEVGGFGMTARYRLRYWYEEEPVVTVAFTQVDGTHTKAVDGRYELEPHDEGSTLVRYTAAVEIGVSVPGFAKRAAEKVVMEAALRSLRGEVLRRSRTG